MTPQLCKMHRRHAECIRRAQPNQNTAVIRTNSPLLDSFLNSSINLWTSLDHSSYANKGLPSTQEVEEVSSEGFWTNSPSFLQFLLVYLSLSLPLPISISLSFLLMTFQTYFSLPISPSWVKLLQPSHSFRKFLIWDLAYYTQFQRTDKSFLCPLYD